MLEARRSRPLGILGAMLGAFVLLLAGCPNPGPPHSPPHTPAPLTPLNTVWDDYNAAPPPMFPNFVWSTNRASEGGDFDIWYARLLFGEGGGGNLEALEGPAPLTATRSPGNEYGPIHYADWGPTEVTGEVPDRLVFASDRAGGRGGLDLYLLDGEGRVTALDGLNSDGDDAYWTFLGDDHAPAYLASNRDGSGMDIYRVGGPEGTEAPLGGPDAEIRVENALSSPSEDTAPFLFHLWGESAGWRIPHVVFASDRPGGQGGFDLWCSRFREGGWEEPRNLGSRVNTAWDEFRPSVSPTDHFLVFSSNRPEGQGGFDLYYAQWVSPFGTE